MKYYAFRDLTHDGNADGITSYHAAGIVVEVYNEKATFSGKDLVVSFIEPFGDTVTSTWRTYSEVELFEIDEFTYGLVQKFHAKVSNI